MRSSAQGFGSSWQLCERQTTEHEGQSGKRENRWETIARTRMKSEILNCWPQSEETVDYEISQSEGAGMRSWWPCCVRHELLIG